MRHSSVTFLMADNYSSQRLCCMNSRGRALQVIFGCENKEDQEAVPRPQLARV